MRSVRSPSGTATRQGLRRSPAGDCHPGPGELPGSCRCCACRPAGPGESLGVVSVTGAWWPGLCAGGCGSHMGAGRSCCARISSSCPLGGMSAETSASLRRRKMTQAAEDVTAGPGLRYSDGIGLFPPSVGSLRGQGVGHLAGSLRRVGVWCLRPESLAFRRFPR